MKFYDLAGQMALGSRLRRLADNLTCDAAKLYQSYGVDLDPRWFPVFYMLSQKESAAITEIALDIGQTHPAVSQVVREMLKAGIVRTQKCLQDSRVNKVSLTDKGHEINSKLATQCLDVSDAIDQLSIDAGVNFWSDIEAIEFELAQSNLYKRVQQQRKKRQSLCVDIAEYSCEQKNAFKQLNQRWIEQHWQMEASDHKALDYPQENIVDKGGYIAIASIDNEVVGTCALLKMDNHSFELAKMAVAESAKGLGIGMLLGEHVIQKSRELGAKRIYLESNSVLVPAINLYRKLGFKRVIGVSSPYQRCNVQMELKIDN